MIDNLLVFTHESAAITDDGYVGNAIDLQKAGLEPGIRQSPLYIVCYVTAGNTGSAGRCQFLLRTGTGLDSSGNIQNTGHANIMPLSQKEQWDEEGLAFVVALPYFQEPQPYKRYLQIYADETTNGLAALKIRAYISFSPERLRTYPDAVN